MLLFISGCVLSIVIFAILLFFTWPKNLNTQEHPLYLENQTLKQKELELEKQLSILETKLQSELNQATLNLEKQKKYYEEKLTDKDTHKLEGEKILTQRLEEREKYYEEKLTDKDTQRLESEKNLTQRLEEREKYFKEQTEQLNLKFENMANKIFSDNTKSYREETTKNLQHILQPFREDVQGFKKSVESFEEKEKFIDTTLQEFREINKKMSHQTKSLQQALKGETQKQGQFGEFILENILEKSGLRKGEEFFTQYELKNEDGQIFRADVVIKLPDNKSIIIDSKAPFKHYMEYYSSSNQTEKEEALKQLLKAVENHIKSLSPKQYHFLKDKNQENLKTPDFTLMFIPNEGIFSLITQTQDIFEKAWQQSIVLVSPANLYATLRTIASIWKIERQNKNAQKIAEESGKMYDKFCNFIKDMRNIDKNIKQAQKSYDSAFNKLEGHGNLVSKIEKIKQLGANAKKDLKEHFDTEELQGKKLLIDSSES